MEKKHEITICLGSSCFSRGNKSVLELIKGYLDEHALKADVFFHGDLCGGQCEKGPLLKIDDRMYSNVSVDNIFEILNDFFGKR